MEESPQLWQDTKITSNCAETIFSLKRRNNLTTNNYYYSTSHRRPICSSLLNRYFSFVMKCNEMCFCKISLILHCIGAIKNRECRVDFYVLQHGFYMYKWWDEQCSVQLTIGLQFVWWDKWDIFHFKPLQITDKCICIPVLRWWSSEEVR